jgi:hypothetical protein
VARGGVRSSQGSGRRVLFVFGFGFSWITIGLLAIGRELGYPLIELH